MAYEQISGEIMTMSNNVETGISGISTDWDGALNRAIEVRWTYPGGISSLNSAPYGDIWGGEIGSRIDELILSYDSGALDASSFRTQVNQIVYQRVTQLLNQGDDVSPSWNGWKESYESCVTVLS